MKRIISILLCVSLLFGIVSLNTLSAIASPSGYVERSTSDAGISFLIDREGKRLVAYQDSVGVWTIGVGHTNGVYPGMTITDAQCELFLRQDLAKAESALNSYLRKFNTFVTQYQYDALISFTHNVGTGWTDGSSYPNTYRFFQTNEHTFSEVQTMFYQWLTPPELKGRRDKEIALYYYGDYAGSYVPDPDPPTYSEPPTTPTVTVDQKIALINDDITISFSAERVHRYWVGIYKDDVLFNDYIVYDSSITVDYPWVGEYHIVVLAINNCGETSGYGSFYVGKEGDYVPENFSATCNKTTVMKNESVTISYSADMAAAYWVGIYHNNEWVLRDNYTTNSVTVNYSDPGEYRVAIVAMNPCSSSETKYVTFTVLDVECAPTKPTVTIDKNVNLINEPIVISFDSIGAEDYWVGIYKDDVLFNDYATTEKQITVDYPWVGEYRVAVVARNSYGSTSGYGGFYVGKEGDYVPTNFTLTGNKTLALKNEAVKVTFNADYATDYWIGVYHNGKWLGTDAITGHTFTMWYSDLGEYSVAVVARNACSSTDAKYFKFTVVEQKTFTIQYDSNGGYGAPRPQSKEYNASIQLSTNTPEKEGYSFVGWNTSANGVGVSYALGATYSINANLLLYAQWEANTYMVKFDGNGSTSGTMSNQTFTYDVVQNLTANTFERAYSVTYNYDGATDGNAETTATATATFNGWATTATGATKVYGDEQNVLNLAQNGTVALYANWTLGVIPLPTPTKTGYSFEGWYTDSELTNAVGTSFTPDRDCELYAKWEKTVITGDADGDGDICLKDVVQLTRYLSGGWNVTVDMSASDVNKDGKVDLKDVVILQRYLAGGWGVQLA